MANDLISAILEAAVESTFRWMLWFSLGIAGATFGIGLLVGWLVWG